MAVCFRVEFLLVVSINALMFDLMWSGVTSDELRFVHVGIGSGCVGLDGHAPVDLEEFGVIKIL